RLQPLARKRQPARRGDVVDVVAGPLAPRPRLPVAGDGAVDEPRVVPLQRLVVDPEALRHAGPEAFEDDVRAPGESLDDPVLVLVLEVESDAALVAVLHVE